MNGFARSRLPVSARSRSISSASIGSSRSPGQPSCTGRVVLRDPAQPCRGVREIKGLTYRWNTAGYHRTMFDVTYSAGVSYRLPYSF
jgi:hypothetical protein